MNEILPLKQSESSIHPTEHLFPLNALMDLLILNPPLDQLIPELLHHIQQYMQVDNVAVLRLDSRTQELIMDTVRGPEEEVASRVHIPVGQGVAGRIFATNQPLIIEDLSQPQVVNSFLAQHLRSLLGVPLQVGDKTIGVLHVSTLQSRRFTQAEVMALQVVGNRIALALDRAQILAQEQAARQTAEQLNKKLQALQAINDVILQHPNFEDLVNSMMSVLGQIMHVDNVAILLPTPESRDLMLYNVHGPEREVAPLVRVPIGKGVAGTIMATGQSLIIDDLHSSNAVNPFLREHLKSLLGVPLQVEAQTIGVLHVSTILPHKFTEEDQALLQVAADRIAVAIARAQAHAQMEQALAQAEQRAIQLIALNNKMDAFLSIASHEMRTPLTAILVTVQVLLRRMQKSSESTSHSQPLNTIQQLERVESHVQRLNRLIQDLLDGSRVQSNQLELHLSQQDIRTIVEDMVEEQRQLHPEYTIGLHMSKSPLLVDIDGDRISQVLINFLSNAIKFTSPMVPIQVKVKSQGPSIRVSVHDQGPGIAEEEQERIWERFHRIKDVETQNSHGGLGLGLYISKGIIDRHHGTIGVVSQPGNGAEFWFAIPRDGRANTHSPPQTE